MLVVIIPVRSFGTGHPALVIDFNIKGWEEGQSSVAFVLELFCSITALFFIFNLLGLSVSFFSLFSSYIITQLKLIAFYVETLPLNDELLLRAHLGEITFLHSIALRYTHPRRVMLYFVHDCLHCVFPGQFKDSPTCIKSSSSSTRP